MIDMIERLYQELTGLAMPRGSALIVGRAVGGYAPVITVIGGTSAADDARVEANIRHTLVERGLGDVMVTVQFQEDPRPLWHGERLVPVVPWNWPTQ